MIQSKQWGSCHIGDLDNVPGLWFWSQTSPGLHMQFGGINQEIGTLSANLSVSASRKPTKQQTKKKRKKERKKEKKFPF